MVDPDAIEPEFVMRLPNEDITLYEGRMVLRPGRADLDGAGRLMLSWLPSPMVTFEVGVEVAGAAGVGTTDLGPATLSVQELGVTVGVEIDSVSPGERVVGVPDTW